LKNSSAFYKPSATHPGRIRDPWIANRCFTSSGENSCYSGGCL